MLSSAGLTRTTIEKRRDTRFPPQMIYCTPQVETRGADFKMLEVLSADPTLNLSEITGLVGKSRQTVSGYLNELEASGKLHRNES